MVSDPYLCSGCFDPGTFLVLFYQEPHYDILGKAAIGAAVTDLVAAFVYPFLTKQKEAEIDNFLTDITEEDYGLCVN